MKLKLENTEVVKKDERVLTLRAIQTDEGVLIEETGDGWSLLTLKVGKDDKMFVELHCGIEGEDRIRTDEDGCIEVESDVD